MKWGHYYEELPKDQLLFWVMQCILRPYNSPLDRWVKEIFVRAGGFGGDPGWYMEHRLLSDGTDAYQIWADPDISGIEPAEVTYSQDAVRQALKKSLIAFAEAYPERSNEVAEVLRRYCQ